MKTLLAPATMALALTLPATAGAATVGTTTVHSRGGSLTKGVAKAYRFTPASTGPVDRLNVYLDGASTASRVEVGMYSGSVSSAGPRRARCVISSPQPNAWNRCSFSAYSVNAGASYWLALLHPDASRGKLQYREGQVSGAPASYMSRNRSLPSLASTWTNASRSSGAYQASIYADHAGSPPPPPPTPDGDGDGVPDSSDQCPGTPAGSPVDANGCPFTLPPPTPTPGPPTADFTVSPNPSVRNQPTSFRSTGTCPHTPCSYAWINNDGVQFGSGVTATFTYVGAVGPRETTLRVTDASGRVASVQKSFQLVEAPSAPSPGPDCLDGRDNDGDGQVDYPSDPGCSSASDDDEANVVVPPPPSGDCDLNATPSNFASQVSAASSGQTVCLASGSYGTWTGTNKQITVRKADGATPAMRFSFGSGDANFTIDGVSGAGGRIDGGVSNVRVRNSAFNTCMFFFGSNSGIVFDNNTHNNIDATCHNSRIHLGGTGVTVRNSEMIGGDADGAFVSSSGFVFENNHVAPCHIGGPTGNHTDGLQYADPGDPANGYAGVVRGNYFDARNCSGLQSLSSYDGGTNGALWEDNVIDTTRPWGIELYADEGSTVRHNTVRYHAAGTCIFSTTCGKILVTHRSTEPRSVGTQVYDNVATVDATDSTLARNDHNTNPLTVIFVGPLTGWAGFELAPGSLGSNAASDGLDTGIRVP